MGELSSSVCQKQFQTYPNSDIPAPLFLLRTRPSTTSSSSFRRTYPVRSVSSSDYVRLRYPSVPPGTDCFAGAATRRSLLIDTTLSPTPSAKTPSSARTSASLHFRPSPLSSSLSLTSGQIVRGQTQYASFGQPGTDRFVRRPCTPLLRRIRRKLRRLLSRPPKNNVSDFRSDSAFRLFRTFLHG